MVVLHGLGYEAVLAFLTKNRRLQYGYLWEEDFLIFSV